MYVVKRPFKNYGVTKVAGDIIDDPATIKHFKMKLADGKIVEVTDENKAYYAEFFQRKFGVDILAQKEEPTEPEVTEEVVCAACTIEPKVVKAATVVVKK